MVYQHPGFLHAILDPLAAKEFYKDLLDEDGYIVKRRATLRKRAGLRDKDSMVTSMQIWLQPMVL